MKRNLLFAIALIGANAIAQIADFETPSLTADTAWFGQNQDLTNSTTFSNGDFEFENTYTVATWGTYTQGWSYSNITDNTTAGSSNDKSNITGSGANSSDQYGVCNVSQLVDHRVFAQNGLAFTPTEAQITNATYTALSMQNGDMFATQFGDVNNASGGLDSLVLTIYGLDHTHNRIEDSVNVYLADFTDGNSLIVNTWLTIDLSSLGSVYGLDFGLISSDNGEWGMNTPAYFAMDNLKATDLNDGDFETTQLTNPETAWYGQDQTLTAYSTFNSGVFNFENTYSVGPYGSYSTAWSYSNMTDVSTPGAINQYSAYTGAGESSSQYGVCNVSSYNNNRVFAINGQAFVPFGAYFTNTTFTALSMLNGDAFATQFGDVNNNAGGEDWLLLTIYGLDEDSVRTDDSVNFYLADYRFASDNEDYIIDEWTYVDLSSLGNVYGLDFELSSSDNGNFGMNTPSYFAMDNLSSGILNIQEKSTSLNIYPNPTKSTINISAPINSTLTLYSVSGQIIMSKINTDTTTQWDLSHLESGIYFIESTIDNTSTVTKIIKD